MRIELRNTSAKTVHIKGWITGLPSAEMVEVTQDGVPVPYLGPDIFRIPTEEALEVGPGASVFEEFSLAKNYLIHHGGTFAIRAKGSDTLSSSDAALLYGDALNLELAARPYEEPSEDVATPTRDLGFKNCSQDQVNELAGSNIGAYVLSVWAWQALNADPVGSRANYWFGLKGSGRNGLFAPAMIKPYLDVFSGTAWIAENNVAQFNCTYQDYCASTPLPTAFTTVYTRSNGTKFTKYEITLCPKFWPLSHNEGEFSHVGILLHEYAHMTSPGVVIDYAYSGDDSSHALALRNVLQAQKNADNYRAFAFNNGGH